MIIGITGVSIVLRSQTERSLAFKLHGHQHYIKATGSPLRAYANDNGDSYPFHTNGWGDALLLLVKSNYADISLICGPTDDGRVFREALEDGTDVPEELCSRIYVQGLSTTNGYNLCVLYDRDSHPGGDHFYQIKQESVRECLVDGAFMNQVNDDRWSIVSQQQVELLMEQDFTRAQAEYYFPDGK